MNYTNDIRKIINLMEATDEPLTLNPLPYAKTALSPAMSEETIDIHYNKLTKNYFKKMNGGPYFEAGAFLHNIWWENLQEPTNNNKPSGKSLELIEANFGDFTKFKEEFKNAAITIQGNGWCVLTKSGKIVIIPNHKKRSDIALLLDMWEHAFFLDFGANKDKYVDSWWKLINWSVVNNRL